MPFESISAVVDVGKAVLLNSLFYKKRGGGGKPQKPERGKGLAADCGCLCFSSLVDRNTRLGSHAKNILTNFPPVLQSVQVYLLVYVLFTMGLVVCIK